MTTATIYDDITNAVRREFPDAVLVETLLAPGRTSHHAIRIYQSAHQRIIVESTSRTASVYTFHRALTVGTQPVQ